MSKRKVKGIIVSIVAVLLAAALVYCFVIYPRNQYACQYAKQISASEVKNIDKVKLISHRGIATEAPENTLPAYELAAKKGFKYVETDVRVTADGVWVLSHDDSLKRMTGFKGNIQQMTLTQVQEHIITKGANADGYYNLVTPTFEQFLKVCKDGKLNPVVELKTTPEEYNNPPYKDILERLNKYGFDDAIIISFSYSALEKVRELDKDIKMLYLVENLDEEVIAKADKLGNCGIDCSQKALNKNKELAYKIIESDMELGVWTVDKADKAYEIISMGANYLTTNAIMP